MLHKHLAAPLRQGDSTRQIHIPQPPASIGSAAAARRDLGHAVTRAVILQAGLFGRQIGHVHSDCSVHLSFTKALKASLLAENLADPLPLAPSSSWAMFNPISAEDAQRAVWLLRLNYVRLRRQRLTPLAASSSALLREHEEALASVSPKVTQVVQRTQALADQMWKQLTDAPHRAMLERRFTDMHHSLLRNSAQESAAAVLRVIEQHQREK